MYVCMYVCITVTSFGVVTKCDYSGESSCVGETFAQNTEHGNTDKSTWLENTAVKVKMAVCVVHLWYIRLVMKQHTHTNGRSSHKLSWSMWLELTCLCPGFRSSHHIRTYVCTYVHTFVCVYEMAMYCVVHARVCLTTYTRPNCACWWCSFIGFQHAGIVYNTDNWCTTMQCMMWYDMDMYVYMDMYVCM